MNKECPCGSKQTYNHCCEIFISGQQQARTPEELMRSRYTAFSLADIDYIQKTMAKRIVEDYDADSTKKWAESLTWLGLTVKKSYMDPANSNKGYVEFEAKARDKAGNIKRWQELSEFKNIDGNWFYSEAHPPENSQTSTIGRNEKCNCGSGKKYKKCCSINS